MLSVARKSVNVARLGLRRGWKSLSPTPTTISATSSALPFEYSCSLLQKQQQPCHNHTVSSRQFTSKADSDGDKNKDMKFVYVHPLSQIVLECLQSNYSEWMMRHGLNDRLSFHRDGTFSLSFQDDDKDDSRIFTTFDEADKKHWLVVKRGKLVGRYMLQDNLMPAWQAGNNRQSLPARIEKAVTEMVEAIEELDRKGTF
jgi:hypothetical protein